MARIELHEVTKVFGGKTRDSVCALDKISFAVSDKEWLVVAGPSGCGKTTLLRLIAGLDRPSSGEILMDGRSMENVLPEQRSIAMVFQEPALYPHMTIFENIGFGLRLRRCSAGEIKERVGWAAEMLEIAECLGRRPIELSGGQRHRVSVARALVRRPEVFLFDEPLGSLDAPMRDQMRRKLLEVCRRAGATVIYVTHDQTQAMMMGDRIAVLRAGRLQQIDTPGAIYAHPGSLFVAQFLGAIPMNLCHGTIMRNGPGLFFEAQGWNLRLAGTHAALLAPFSGKPVVLGIRPETIALAQGDEREQVLDAVVEVVDDLGADKLARLSIAGQPLVARFPPTVPLPGSGLVRLKLMPSSLRFFDPVTGKAIS